MLLKPAVKVVGLAVRLMLAVLIVKVLGAEAWNADVANVLNVQSSPVPILSPIEMSLFPFEAMV